MMDEAARKGMTIDTHALGIALGVPVVEAIGVRGRGIIETFHTAQEVATGGDRPHAFIYAPEVEGVVEELAEKIAVSAQGQPAAIPKESGAGTEESGVRSDLRTPMESIGLQKSESQESVPMLLRPPREEPPPT
jgi:Fe2+ transport system protein B